MVWGSISSMMYSSRTEPGELSIKSEAASSLMFLIILLRAAAEFSIAARNSPVSSETAIFRCLISPTFCSISMAIIPPPIRIGIMMIEATKALVPTMARYSRIAIVKIFLMSSSLIEALTGMNSARKLRGSFDNIATRLVDRNYGDGRGTQSQGRKLHQTGRQSVREFFIDDVANVLATIFGTWVSAHELRRSTSSSF